MGKRKPDFSGWATRFGRRCSDGRTILKGAFDCDGARVPLVWNHEHDNPERVLGHADLHCRDDGVWTDCYFNTTTAGETSRELVCHGDIVGLSIYANHLKENKRTGEVSHGEIKEVSLVLAGANPGAYIESVLAHSDAAEDTGVFLNMEDGLEVTDAAWQRIYEPAWDDLEHGDDESGDGEALAHAEEEKKESEGDKPMADNKERTVQDVIDGMTEEQKNVMYALIGQAIENERNGAAEHSDEDEEDETVKHNVFDSDYESGNYLSHDDMQAIFKDAKRLGSLREAVNEHLDGGVLAHTGTVPTEGMDVATGTQTYGVNDISMLLPEYHNLNNPPEFIKRETSWVAKVMGGVKKSPFSRVRSTYANLTEDEARAKGYIKGHQKKEEVFTTLKRATDPQTIYKKQKLDRDDILDITDFDLVAWLKSEMRVMLDEEKARAILIGDGRPSDSEYKISEDHVRPIVKDVPLFNIKKVITIDEEKAAEAKDEASYRAKQIIREALKARKEYKGSGNPTFFTTEDWLTEMLLIEDEIGHRLYKTEAELCTALRVKDIVTVEVMEGYKIGDDDLIGVIVNLNDYNVGADKGGETTLFDDFDIDYNQYKYLMECRMSGALVKPFSAITLCMAAG